MREISKVLKKKIMKEQDLYDAAFELFITKGFNDTAINDIVSKAGVAKGTFYLYFKDKYDIFDRIILKKTSVLLSEALKATVEKSFEDFMESMFFFIDYIIEYLKENRILLKLIYKNLSWGICKKALNDPNNYKEIKEIYHVFIDSIDREQLDVDDTQKTLFMVVELIGSVCYSSIIMREPDSIEEMKPLLFKMIRKMLSK